MVLMLLGVYWSGPASSHEVRPAFLQITERAGNHSDILWKQPTLGTMALHLVPQYGRRPSKLWWRWLLGRLNTASS